ncbi:hypothetical protein ACSLNR_28590, partial [Escherichia coli]|uniref:hypothetical protein n=1 Tax=Escherichia coli TaxID=562 RepID=UPI003EE3CB2F
FGTSFNALFFQRPAVNEAPFKAMLSHMFVVLHLPAFSQFPQLHLNGLNHRHVDFLWDSEHGQHRRKITHAPVIGGASATYRNG